MTTTTYFQLPPLDDSRVDREFMQRAMGAVLGSAVGDALGAPFEFGPSGAYSAAFPEPVRGGCGEMQGGRGWKPAEFTDDTQMAIIQAESLLANHGLDETELFERFRMWASDANDVGIQTRAVLGSDLVGSAAATEHYERTGRAAGNGTIMRAAPTAVLLARAGEEDSAEFARRTAVLTHGDPAAGWGTAILHTMIRAALLGDEPWAALTRALASLPDDQHIYRQILRDDWTPQEGVRFEGGDDLPNGTVWTCLAQAVWAVRASDSFSDAIITTIDLGGDTDTVAAVAGGLAGAIWGVAAIPSRWTTYLNGTITTPEGKRKVALDDLRKLVHDLAGRPAPAGPKLGSVVDRRSIEGADLDRNGIDELFDQAGDATLATGLGPTEVLPGVHAADLRGATNAPTDWGVVSLCLVGDLFENHPYRREVYLVDQDPDASGNPNIGLEHALEDVLSAVEAFRAEGRKVLVHCYGGASRTGLVLRALLMQDNDWTDQQAISYLQDRWPHLGLWNQSFTERLATT